ncbi:transglycosylase SLT domain-containing protein [Salmonella enterica]|nr:transglycosylase SLT domain-containing protein [Salmonella enterica]EKB7612337.1 transglycosylase SLT domain-containing protein [Salmonella enterica]
MNKWIFCISLILISSISNASDCFDLAGRDYRIDPDLLRAIAWHESGFNPTATGRNSDSSIDVGVMQINSQHFSQLSSVGITKDHLYTDPCMNIYTGAYFLAVAFKRWGVSWQAVGAYNAGFRQSERQSLRRLQYARKIEQIYSAIKSSQRYSDLTSRHKKTKGDLKGK